MPNWCLQTVGLKKTFESPLDSNEIKPVNPKGNQPWISIGRNDAEAEALILWPPDAKRWLIEKYPDAGQDWRQEEEWMTEDETVGCHHWLNRHEFEQTLGDSGGQRKLACCSPWGLRVRHELATEQQQQKSHIHTISIRFFEAQIGYYNIGSIIWEPLENNEVAFCCYLAVCGYIPRECYHHMWDHAIKEN